MGKKFTIGVLIGNVHTAHPKDLMRGIRAAASGMDVNVIYFLGTQSVRFNQKFALEDFDYQYNTVYDYAKLAKVSLSKMYLIWGQEHWKYMQSLWRKICVKN